MSTLDAIAEKLPDVYFDWYARFLPGVAGIPAYAYKAPTEERIFIAQHIISFAILGYVLGHFIQPLSSGFVKINERLWGDENKLEEHKRKPVAEQKEGLMKKASKAHAEAVSMSSAAMLIFFVFIYSGQRECHLDSWLLGVTGLLVASSLERVRARKRKIGVLE